MVVEWPEPRNGLATVTVRALGQRCLVMEAKALGQKHQMCRKRTPTYIYTHAHKTLAFWREAPTHRTMRYECTQELMPKRNANSTRPVMSVAIILPDSLPS